uniref:BHLH domain-containing protein n=1 Tax=Heterorhabditis bacteriophora TaxID=37862 RepID=A0A1I7WQC0_HETBA
MVLDSNKRKEGQKEMNPDQSGLPPVSVSSFSTPSVIDLQALLASMPEFPMLPALPPMGKAGPSGADEDSQLPLFPAVQNDHLAAALSLSMFNLPGFPMFPIGGMPNVLPNLSLAPMSGSLPPHSTIESLGLITPNLHLRPTVSAMASPVQAEIRPRAFSSAATLQHPKSSTPDKRRKRSRKADDESSVLRMLMNEEDDAPLKLRTQPICKEEEQKIRLDAARVSVLSASASHPLAKRASPERTIDFSTSTQHMPLRRIIRDQDLPDSVGPDSPFRHHPKYQRKQRDAEAEVIEGMEALTAFCVVNGYMPKDEAMETETASATSVSPAPSPKNSTDSGYSSISSPKKSFSEIIDHAICRELVTAE